MLSDDWADATRRACRRLGRRATNRALGRPTGSGGSTGAGSGQPWSRRTSMAPANASSSSATASAAGALNAVRCGNSVPEHGTPVRRDHGRRVGCSERVGGTASLGVGAAARLAKRDRRGGRAESLTRGSDVGTVLDPSPQVGAELRRLDLAVMGAHAPCVRAVRSTCVTGIHATHRRARMVQPNDHACDEIDVAYRPIPSTQCGSPSTLGHGRRAVTKPWLATARRPRAGPAAAYLTR